MSSEDAYVALIRRLVSSRFHAAISLLDGSIHSSVAAIKEDIEGEKIKLLTVMLALLAPLPLGAVFNALAAPRLHRRVQRYRFRALSPLL